MGDNNKEILRSSAVKDTNGIDNASHAVESNVVNSDTRFEYTCTPKNQDEFNTAIEEAIKKANSKGGKKSSRKSRKSKKSKKSNMKRRKNSKKHYKKK